MFEFYVAKASFDSLGRKSVVLTTIELWSAVFFGLVERGFEFSRLSISRRWG